MADSGVAVKGLGFPVLARMYLRSFFSQGSFAFSMRQNIGFVYCLEPAGSRIWSDPEDRKRFYLRHLEYYNGNPFMVTLVLGAVAKMEERFRDGDGVSEEDIRRFKLAVGPAVGAVGDRFFWRTLRPFGIATGLLGVFWFGVWGIPLFLALFNLPVLFLRWYWLVRGYSLGPRVVIEIKNHTLERAAGMMEALGAAMLAFFLVICLGRLGGGYSGTAGSMTLFVFALIMPRSWMPPSIVMAVSAVLAVVIGFLAG